jgi:hypothetical protein
MPSIRELVTEVERQRASAFSVLGGSALMMTIDGSSQPGAELSEADINGIVETDLNQDQQTDIMVGRPVGLSMEIDGAVWRVLVQPMPTGIAVRGTREGEPAAAGGGAQPQPDSFGVGVPLDDDDDLSIAVEEPVDPDNPPTPPPGVLDAFDFGALPDPAPSHVPNRGTPPPVAPDPFDSHAGGGGVSPAQDDGFGMVAAPQMPPEEREATLYDSPGGDPTAGGAVGGHDSTLLQMGGAVQAPPPDPTDPSAAAVGMTDGTLLMQHSPKVHPPAPEPAAPEPVLADSPSLHGEDLASTGSAEEPSGGGHPPVPDMAMPRRRADTGSHGTLMAMRPPGMGPGGPGELRRKPTPSRSIPRHPTGAVPRSDELEGGALCFCRELPEAFEAGRRIGMGVEVVDETDIVEGRGPTIKRLGIEPGATLIVNLDDPSQLLGWVLLRREEGFRVFVVTRATGPGGARRILLGTAATQRAEEWLDEHPVYALIGGHYQPM